MDGAPTPAPSARVRTEGGARMRFEVSDGESRLAELWQHDPMRVLLPTAFDDVLPHAVVINTSGGLVGGDRVEIECAVGADARALVTTQAAEKVYRSAGSTTMVASRLTLGPRAWLEWLPNETILFDGARLRRRLDVEVAAGAQLLAGEILVFGRIARHERFTSGALRDDWMLRRDGRLLWCDALGLADDPGRVLGGGPAFGEARAIATLVHVGARPDAARDMLRGVFAERADVGVSLIGEVIVARFAMVEPHRLRRLFAQAWIALRQEAGGLPPILPGLWHG